MTQPALGVTSSWVQSLRHSGQRCPISPFYVRAADGATPSALGGLASTTDFRHRQDEKSADRVSSAACTGPSCVYPRLIVIPNVQRGETALSALTYVYDRAAQDAGVRPRLLDGDCHGAPVPMDDQVALAAAVQIPQHDGAQPYPGRPIMLCSLHSSPDLPPPDDAEWIEKPLSYRS